MSSTLKFHFHSYFPLGWISAKIPPREEYGMERELRLKAFMEEYSRIVQLFDDIVSMKESMTRLETYMIIMVCQVAGAMIVSYFYRGQERAGRVRSPSSRLIGYLQAVSLFLLFRFCQSQMQRGEYEIQHRFESNPALRKERKNIAAWNAGKMSFGQFKDA